MAIVMMEKPALSESMTSESESSPKKSKTKHILESDNNHIQSKHNKRNIQSVLLSVNAYTEISAEKWLREHNFKITHRGKPGQKEGVYYHYRQKDPRKDKEYRTINAYKDWEGVKYIVEI